MAEYTNQLIILSISFKWDFADFLYMGYILVFMLMPMFVSPMLVIMFLFSDTLIKFKNLILADWFCENEGENIKESFRTSKKSQKLIVHFITGGTFYLFSTVPCINKHYIWYYSIQEWSNWIWSLIIKNTTDSSGIIKISFFFFPSRALGLNVMIFK